MDCSTMPHQPCQTVSISPLASNFLRVATRNEACVHVGLEVANEEVLRSRIVQSNCIEVERDELLDEGQGRGGIAICVHHRRVEHVAVVDRRRRGTVLQLVGIVDERSKALQIPGSVGGVLSFLR